MADSVETLRVDLRTRVKRLGGKEQARRKRKARFSLIKKNQAFQKSYMRVGVKKLLRAGMMPARTWGVHAVGMAPTERLQLRWQQLHAKRVRPLCPCSWKHVAWKWRRNSPPCPLSTGQKEAGRENDITNKEKRG